MEGEKIKKPLLELSRQTLLRLPDYLNFLKLRKKEGYENISAPIVAAEMNLNEVQVRKDLAAVSSVAGKPKTGYNLSRLIGDIESLLGYDNVTDAVIVGVGHLGKALLAYKGFEEYGVKIIAGFDINNKPSGAGGEAAKVFPMKRFSELVKRMNVHIGIITVSADEAQGVCDLMVESGIRAIWNFAPVHLKHPAEVFVKNENLAVSLALLSQTL